VFGALNGDPGSSRTVVSSVRTPNVVLGTALRDLSAHIGTPWNGVNQAVAARVRGLSRAIAADPDHPRTAWDPPFSAIPGNTHKETAPNPLHLLLIAG
jgi:hypothetical protein